MEFREGAFDFQTSQQNRKFIPEDFQNLQLENMRLEDLFRLADDDKYRFEKSIFWGSLHSSVLFIYSSNGLHALNRGRGCTETLIKFIPSFNRSMVLFY